MPVYSPTIRDVFVDFVWRCERQ